MSSKYPHLVKYIQNKTLNFATHHFSMCSLFFWNITQGLNNLEKFQEQLLKAHKEEKAFAILIISKETSTKAFSETIGALISNFKVSLPLTSKLFKGFLDWNEISSGADFILWKKKYNSLNKKKKISLLNSIKRYDEANILKSSKTGELENEDEIVAILCISKRKFSFDNFHFISNGAECAVHAILAINIIALLGRMTGATFEKVGPIIGFFRYIGAGINKVGGCLQGCATCCVCDPSCCEGCGDCDV